MFRVRPLTSLLAQASAKPSIATNAIRRTVPASVFAPGKVYGGNGAAEMTMQRRWASEDHKEETYEEFTERYLKFFKEEADDLFELSRGMNNAFSADLVPPPEVLIAAMQAARRLNSFALAARVVEALHEKLNGDKKVYEEYLAELKPTMDELGVPTPEELARR